MIGAIPPPELSTMLRPFLRAWSRVVIVAAVAATAGAQSPPYSPQAVSTALH